MVALLHAEVLLGLVGLLGWSTAPPCLTGIGPPAGGAVAAGSVDACQYVPAHLLPGQTGLIIAAIVTVHLASAVATGLRLWRRTCKALAASTKIPTPPARVTTPMAAYGTRLQVVEGAAGLCHTAGLLRPRVVLSAETIETLNDDELAAVLAHESVHVRHRHPLLVLVARAVLAPLTSLAPWTNRLLEHCLLEAELKADKEAVARTGRPQLAAALAKLATWSVPTGALGANSLLAARVAHLAGDGYACTNGRRRAAAATLAPLALLAAVAVQLSSPRDAASTLTLESGEDATSHDRAAS